MKRSMAVVVLAFYVVNTFAAACDFGRMTPWTEGRSPSGAEEYHNLRPFEVTILKGGNEGTEQCTYTASRYATLVVPHGLDTTAEYRNLPEGMRSWINVGGASYPVISRYRLVIHESAFVPVPAPIMRSQPRERPQTFQGSGQEESNCDNWCKAGWIAVGLIVAGFLLKNKNGKDDNGGGSGAPVNPAP